MNALFRGDVIECDFRSVVLSNQIRLDCIIVDIRKLIEYMLVVVVVV